MRSEGFEVHHVSASRSGDKGIDVYASNRLICIKSTGLSSARDTARIATLEPMLRAPVLLLLGFLAGCGLENNDHPMNTNEPSPGALSPQAARVSKSEEEWRKELSPEQFHVLREAGTERPFGPAYDEFKKQGAGTYVCGACGAELFASKEKFDSHCGWPSFYDPANATNVVTREDYTLGTKRTEVLCARCGGHLGHVFTGEGFATPTDKRYCINGVSLKFIPANNSKP